MHNFLREVNDVLVEEFDLEIGDIGDLHGTTTFDVVEPDKATVHARCELDEITPHMHTQLLRLTTQSLESVIVERNARAVAALVASF